MWAGELTYTGAVDRSARSATSVGFVRSLVLFRKWREIKWTFACFCFPPRDWDFLASWLCVVFVVMSGDCSVLSASVCRARVIGWSLQSSGCTIGPRLRDVVVKQSLRWFKIVIVLLPFVIIWDFFSRIFFWFTTLSGVVEEILIWGFSFSFAWFN